MDQTLHSCPWLLPCFAGVAFIAAPVHGEDAATNSFHLAPVVVTANPLGSDLFDMAQVASVLSGDDLKLRLQPTLGETLAREPGVSSTSYGPNASRPVIRGLGGDHIRILQNGLGTVDASSASDDHAVSFDTLGVKRIEVVRGPAALLYGSTAVGGVVNVIDNRIPSEPAGVPFGGSLQTRYDSSNNERAFGGLAEGGAKGFNYHLDGFKRITENLTIPGYARSERLRALDPLPPGDAEVQNSLPNSQSRNDGGTGGLSYAWDKGYFGSSVSGYNNDYGTVAEKDVTIRMYQRRLDFAGAFNELGAFVQSVKYKLGLSEYKHTEYEGPATGTIFRNRGYDARVEAVQDQRGRLSGAFGYQSQKSDFSATGEEAFMPRTSGFGNSLFAFEEIDYAPIKLQAGARLDLQNTDSAGGAAFGPAEDHSDLTGSGSLGVVYAPSKDYNVTLSGSYSQRAPNGQELYANGPHLATASYEVGDRSLNPEESVGLDLSVRKRTGRVTGSVGGFFNYFQNFITDVPTGLVDATTGLPIFQYRGLGAQFLGAEAKVTFMLIEEKTWHFDLDLFSDYTEAVDRATDEPLPRIPPLRYGGALAYHGSALGARFEARRLEAQHHIAEHELPTDGSTILTVSVDYHWHIDRVEMEFFVKADNLLDEEIRNHVSLLKDIAPLAGRSVTVGVQAEF